jgi:hypothetical protein
MGRRSVTYNYVEVISWEANLVLTKAAVSEVGTIGVIATVVATDGEN